MTPAVGWNELDYFRASRRARRLGEARLAQKQIQGVLDEADAGAVGLVEPALPHSPLTGGLDPKNHEGGGALPSKSARHRQGGPV